MSIPAAQARAFQLACRARHQTIPLPTLLSSTTCPTAHAPSTSSNTNLRARAYATHTSSSSSNPPPPARRAITVTTDDGRYNWSDLSTSEKAARSTQQTFNFLLVGAGAVGVTLVSYFLYQELFAPDSKTVQFNHAVNRIKADERCRELLGPSRKIRAFGEPTTSKWARARPLAYQSDVDSAGVKRFRMHFNVEGPKGEGVVNVVMSAREGEGLEYEVLSLSVRGEETVFLEGGERKVKEKVGKMFGYQWR